MKKPAILRFCGILLVVSLLFTNYFRDYRGNEHPFISDVDQYYSYLPAALIHHDLSFKFPNAYWLVDAPNGNRVPKVSMGMAVLYSPWFLIAEGINKTFGIDDKGGYSLTHIRVFELGSALYLVTACLLLLLVLRRYFTEKVALIAIGLTVLGTNLFYYAYGWSLMAHLYQFFVFSSIIYLTVRWYEKQRHQHAMLLGFMLGIAVIVRPVDIFIGLIPVLYGITGIGEIKDRMIWWRKNWIDVLLLKVAFFIPVFLQLFYWKIYAGEWLFFSYGSSERFFFDNPQLLNFLFSYRKGWLLYTPLMAFALLGFWWLRNRVKELWTPILLIIGINLYLLSSWWAWWYGGSFGNRSMVQYYALLIFPLAALIANRAEQQKGRIALLTLGGLLVALNIFQTHQYKKSLIHWDSMTKEAYWAVFLKNGAPENFDALIWEPDYEGMKRNGFENGIPVKQTLFENGKAITAEEEFPGGFDFSLNKLEQSEVGKLRSSVQLKSDSPIDNGLFMVFTAQDGDSMLVYKSVPLVIENNETGKWKTFVIKHNLVGLSGCNLTLKLYIWNKDKRAVNANKFQVTN